MNTTTDATTTWPDLAIGLYDRLTGRKAEITYEMEDFQVMVPAGADSGVQSAPWTLNGRLRISTRDRSE